jgi:hypothetical protein
MKMILLKIVLIIGVLTTITQADCPLSEQPEKTAECLRYIATGLYGVAVNDLTIVCRIASDIGNCARDRLGDCVAAEVGRKALDQIRDIVVECCPDRNKPRCPIRDKVIQEQRCFAADSLVTLPNGKQKSITELQSGESVLGYDDKTKQVVSTQLLTMLDFQPNRFALFKQVTTVTGRQLALTSSHLLPTDSHGYVMAKYIQTGMNIYVMNDNGILMNETVSDVSDVVKQGYLAPLTEEGTLIVNNVAASCYATINSHHTAHAVLAPMRWWYTVFGQSNESNEMIGVHWFPKMLFEMTTFLMPSIIQK